MHEIQSSSRNSCCANEERSCGIKRARDIIQDLERYGPAGLIHVIVLSSIIGRSIKIWNYDGTLNRIIGKGKELPVNIEYHPTDSEHTQIGHWTLRHGKDPDNSTIDLNSCLFSVIGSQTGQDPSKLREQSMLELSRNLEKLAHWIDDIIRLEGNGGVMLMIGGARYNGQSPKDAAKILDKSQNAKAIPDDSPRASKDPRGHPRGHASHATNNTASVEKYSIGDEKTGFLSRTDQDLVAHIALTTKQAQNAMAVLNRGQRRERITIMAETLVQRIGQYCILPKASWFVNGVKDENDQEIKNVVLILTHHIDKFKNLDADVLVLTFFPRT